MTRTLQIAHVGLAVAGIIACGGGFYLEMVTAHATKVQSAELKKDSQAVQATFTNINRPCKGKAGPDACGTLAQINKSVIDIGNAVVTMQTQVKQTGKLTDAAAKNLNRAGDDLHAATVALTGTAKAATQTLHGASVTLSTMNDSIAATKPLITAATATAANLDSAIANPANAEIAANLKHLTANANRITKDAADEADKLAHPPKKKLGFWGAMAGAGMWAHKWLMPSIF